VGDYILTDETMHGDILSGYSSNCADFITKDSDDSEIWLGVCGALVGANGVGIGGKGGNHVLAC